MRTLRLAPVALLASVLALAAGPAQAAGAGCPPVFTLAPVSVLGSNIDGQVDNVNHDGYICVKTINKGYVIFVDNVTP